MTDKPTDAMIEAGLKAREACNFHGTDERKQVAEIYRYMHEARPQSTAPSPDADLVERTITFLRNHHIWCTARDGRFEDAARLIEALTATAPRPAILQVLDGTCPECGGSLDTGYECNKCDFDGIALVHLREACEARGDRMHPSGLYFGEMRAAPPSDSDAKLAEALKTAREWLILICEDAALHAFDPIEARRDLAKIDAALCTCQKFPTHCANDCPLHGEDNSDAKGGEA